VLLSILLLGHDRIRGLSGEAYAIQTYILYLQISLATTGARWRCIRGSWSAPH